MSAGRFITIEGIEGAGKSTLAQRLAASMRRQGIPVLLTREPGGTPLAERLRAIVLDRGEERIDSRAETLIMFAARAIHLENLIKPALASGTWVICDRFTDATRAYQGAGRGVSLDFIDQVAAQVHPDLWPHRTLLLDLPVDVGLERVRARQGGGDRFEDENVRFFERVRSHYLLLAAAEPARVRLLDASGGAEQVASNGWSALADLLPAVSAGRE
ncbi:MAG TPA: dTMP kinase [Steroidobacteraceae bacterium]|jgi:dTMP kinase|nr:dTMP kinase [Steroidobacteraceae bacterium]